MTVLVWLTAAGVGLIASLGVHLATFFDFEVKQYFLLVLFLHLAMFVIFLAAIDVSNYDVAKFGRSRLEGVSSLILEMPKVAFFSILCGLGILFIYACHTSVDANEVNDNGVTTEINGKFVLDSKGRVIRELSEREYVVHRAYEFRADTAGLMLFYTLSVLYLFALFQMRSQKRVSTTTS